MSRSRRLFLQDMLECARKVVRYTAHLTREQFFSSELEYDATLRNLEILGEAAKKVPDELKHQYPSVDWRGIAGFRMFSHTHILRSMKTRFGILSQGKSQS
jgi:uncharacterized protein with HEPN domain